MKFTKSETLFGIFAGTAAVFTVIFIGSMCYEVFWQLTHEPRMVTVEINFPGNTYTVGILTRKTEFDSLENVYLHRYLHTTTCCKNKDDVTVDLFKSYSTQRSISGVTIETYLEYEEYLDKYQFWHGTDSLFIYVVTKQAKVLHDPLWKN